MKKGLYIGRFQPFHLGHLSAVKQAFKKVDQLIIGIGSSQYTNTSENPLTALERQKIIDIALQETGFAKERYKIIEIPDIHDDPKWPAHVRSIVREFHVLIVGEDGIVKGLFDQFDPLPVLMVKREFDISATKIRTAIKKGQPWTDFVSPKTADELEGMKFEKRIRDLNP